MIAGPEHTPGGTLRPGAFTEAVESSTVAGPAPRVVAVEHGDYTAASGREAATTILATHPGIDAIFAANDMMARGAIDALHAQSRSVPDDVLVGGFDDSAGAAAEAPHLTTVRQDFRRIAEELVDALGKQIDGGVRTNVAVPSSSSCGTPPPCGEGGGPLRSRLRCAGAVPPAVLRPILPGPHTIVRGGPIRRGRIGPAAPGWLQFVSVASLHRRVGHPACRPRSVGPCPRRRRRPLGSWPPCR